MLEILLAAPRGGGLPADTGPGPTTIAGSNSTAGFYGEVASANMITGSALATAVGITTGTLMNDATAWLKFFIDNKVVFIPKLPIRYGNVWDDFYKAGVVYGDNTYGRYPSSANRLQNAQVTIGSWKFKVRLIRGDKVDPADVSNITSSSGVGSEWNRLFYNVTDTSQSKVGQDGPNWAHYTEAQLGLSGTNGIYTWCQEYTSVSARVGRICRGSPYITSYLYGWLDTTYTSTSWRPVLELIPAS